MKVILTAYEPNNAILMDNQIDAIYYEGKQLIYVDCNGNNIPPEELEKDILADVLERVESDGGDEVDGQETDQKENDCIGVCEFCTHKGESVQGEPHMYGESVYSCKI